MPFMHFRTQNKYFVSEDLVGGFFLVAAFVGRMAKRKTRDSERERVCVNQKI